MQTQKKTFWKMLSISGVIGVLFYTAHVFVGGILWEGYSHISQAISELTASGAPNAEFLRVLTTIYGVFAVVFSISLYFIFRAWKVHKAALTGAVLLMIMEVFSLVGYGLFPLDEAGAAMSFQNVMHIVVTTVVVLCTLGSTYFVGIGLMKSPGFKKLGVFTFICALIITVAGLFTPIAMANGLPTSGLAERINIFTLQTWIFVLSIFIFGKKQVEEH